MGHIFVGHAPRWEDAVIRGRFAMATGLVSLLFGVAGCASAPVSETPAQTIAPANAASAKAAGHTLIPIQGYTYTTAPAGIRQMTAGLDATGMVSSVVGRGVKDSSGAVVAAIVLAQYNPKLTALLKKASISQVLAGAVKGAKAFGKGKATVTSLVLSGNQVRLLRTSSVSFAVAYKPGGLLIEILGGAPGPVIKVATAYLAATSH